MIVSSRVRPGDVRDAVEEYLRNAVAPASPKEITEAVGAQLQRPIAPSSVRSYLTLHEGVTVERTARGQYLLLGSEHSKVQRDPLPLVYESNKCRLYQGDCFAWIEQIDDRSIQAVVTDPPYGLREYSTDQIRKMRQQDGGVWRIPPSFDGHQRAPLPRFTVLTEWDKGNLELFFRSWATKLFPKMVPGAHVLVASNPLLSYVVANAITSAGFERRGEIVRLVMTMRGGDRPKNAHEEFPDVTVMPRSMWEPWLLFRKPLEGRVQDNLKKWKTGGMRRVSASQPFGDVIASHPTRSSERKLAPHPSLKPQAFLRQVVRAVLPLGEGVVLDPFAGAGSTLAAAEHLGYASIGVEKDPAYVEMATRAIPRLTAL